MKKLLSIFLGSLLTLPAFAEVAPVYYDEYDAEYYDDGTNNPYADPYYGMDEYLDEEQPAAVPSEPVANDTPAPVKPAIISPRATAGRTAATTGTTVTSRATPSASSGRVISRGTTVRPVASRGTTATMPQSRGMVSSANAPISRVSVSSSAPVSNGVQTVAASDSRRASGDNRTVSARAGLLQADTINQPLYIGTGTNPGPTGADRVAIRPGSAIMARSPGIQTMTAPTTNAPTKEEITQDDLIKATELCKEQYYGCMDNFCNVLDETQGRCVCSSNANKYREVEDALKQATEALQDVAQKIQYIGLTKDEIEAIFKQTEAEAALVGKKDTSQIKADLDKIKKMIIEVDSTKYSSNDFTFLFNVDFSFDNGFDLSDWLMGMNNGSVLRQRGTELYTSATNKCRTSTIEQCKKMGVDTAVLISAYDLEIDRKCIEYEKVLDDENSQMKRTVRNANNVLQKARLVIAQNKNIYDLRGCVNALDACMQDDFACGTDYEFCLDPTGKYIADGEVIVGSTPGFFDASKPQQTGLFGIWNYAQTNAWSSEELSGTNGNLDGYIANKIKGTTSADMVGFLQAKIGQNNGTRNIGMCMSVLNQCQDQTYTGANKTYNPANDVVRQYLVRTTTLIKAQQDEIVASFAESCISRLQSCLVTNGAITGYDSANRGKISYASYNACRALITSCASVNNDTVAGKVGVNVIGTAMCYMGKALPKTPQTGETVDCPVP